MSSDNEMAPALLRNVLLTELGACGRIARGSWRRGCVNGSLAKPRVRFCETSMRPFALAGEDQMAWLKQLETCLHSILGHLLPRCCKAQVAERIELA